MGGLFNKIKLLYSGKARRIAQHKKMFELKSAKERFEYIYKKRLWTSKESISGSGSTLNFTKNIRHHLPKIFTQFNISSVLDAPCGDFNWMQHVLKECDSICYIGGDIVDTLVQENNKKYATNNISFITLDITKNLLPDVDLIIVRDCLFHLSYTDISLFLENLSKSNIEYILTTGHTEVDNIDITTGSYRDINLFAKPFNFDKRFLYEIEEEGRKLYLFKCSQLSSYIDYD